METSVVVAAVGAAGGDAGMTTGVDERVGATSR